MRDIDPWSESFPWRTGCLTTLGAALVAILVRALIASVWP